MSIRSAVSLFRGQRDFHMNIIGKRRWWFAFSGVLLLLSFGGLFVRQLNLGIDFRGGALFDYANEAGVTPDEVRAKLEELGHPDSVVQIVDGDQVSVKTEDLGDDRTAVVEALAEQAGVQSADVNVQVVGPKWGEQISRKALQSLLIFLVVVSIYIAFRFEWKMALAALVALFHDVVITGGVYALTGREVTPETVIAVLTILGYSLYDTVVIFDKVQENAESQALVLRETYSGTVNISLNQVMMRSVNTSLVVLLPIGALLFFGGDTLKDFAFALFVGVAIGAYSSIFVAAPVLATLKEREPRMTQIRQRAERGGRAPLQPMPAAAVSGDGEGDGTMESAAAPPRSGGASSGQQAPRRKGKKRPRSGGGKRKR